MPLSIGFLKGKTPTLVKNAIWNDPTIYVFMEIVGIEEMFVTDPQYKEDVLRTFAEAREATDFAALGERVLTGKKIVFRSFLEHLIDAVQRVRSRS